MIICLYFQNPNNPARIVDLLFNLSSSFKPFQDLFQGLGGAMKCNFTFAFKKSSILETKQNILDPKIVLTSYLNQIMVNKFSRVPEDELNMYV